MNYTYIVQCADGTLYTGWTNCLEKRLKAHNSGKNGAKYTKTKRPVLKNLSKIFYLTISSNRHICHKTIHHNKMTRASQHNKYVENLM